MLPLFLKAIVKTTAAALMLENRFQFEAVTTLILLEMLGNFTVLFSKINFDQSRTQ